MNIEVIRVMIVDDHPIVREGLTALIETRQDMKVVAEASDGRDAVEVFSVCHPDVVLMDLRLPVMDGTEATREIRLIDPNARIIILTTFDGDEYIITALRAGAKAYLLKTTSYAELVKVIKTVHSGETYVPGAIAALLQSRLSAVELTSRERTVLDLIATGATNQEIGNQLYITESTVKSHVNRILVKMNVNDRTQAVTEGMRRGLIRFATPTVP